MLARHEVFSGLDIGLPQMPDQHRGLGLLDRDEQRPATEIILPTKPAMDQRRSTADSRTAGQDDARASQWELATMWEHQ
jgi:hypothetical protein